MYNVTTFNSLCVLIAIFSLLSSKPQHHQRWLMIPSTPTLTLRKAILLSSSPTATLLNHHKAIPLKAITSSLLRWCPLLSILKPPRRRTWVFCKDVWLLFAAAASWMNAAVTQQSSSTEE